MKLDEKELQTLISKLELSDELKEALAERVLTVEKTTPSSEGIFWTNLGEDKFLAQYTSPHPSNVDCGVAAVIDFSDVDMNSTPDRIDLEVAIEQLLDAIATSPSPSPQESQDSWEIEVGTDLDDDDEDDDFEGFDFLEELDE